MNSLKIIMTILCLLLFFTGCGDNVSYKEVSQPGIAAREIADPEVPDTETMSIRVVKKKEIILDTGEDVIGFVMDIKIAGNNILVIDPIYSKKCFYFDDKGKLLYTLGRHGEGPGEVPMLCAACISGERIFVFGNYRLVIYDRKNGREIKTMKKPFRSICNNLYPGPDGTVFALSYNRYNKNRDTIYHLDNNGTLIYSFSKADDVPEVFDTYFPQTGILIHEDKIYQFFNFKYEISMFDTKGRKKDDIKLDSRFYTEPNLKEARSIKRRDEKKFRATFTQISGIFKHSKGFITVLTNWKDIKTSQTILEFWSDEFKKIGNCDFDKSEDLVHYHDDNLITIDSDQDEQKLEFWDIIFQSVKNKEQQTKSNQGV